MATAFHPDEALFRNLVENTYDVVGLLDAEANILYSSPSIQTVLGYTPEELADKNAVTYLVHPADIVLTQKKLGLLLKAPTVPQTAEFRLRHKNGSWRWMEAIGTNLFDNPHVRAIAVNYHDITEKKLAEKHLRNVKRSRATMLREKARDEAILDSVGDGMFATDRLGKIFLLNNAAEELLGIGSDEFLGKRFYTVIPTFAESGEEIPPSKRLTMVTMKTGVKQTGVFYYSHKDKTRFPVSITVSPIIFNHKIAGSITVFRDITKEKELDEAKNEFVSLASHQLRTPMTAIKGFLSMIESEDYGPIPEKLEKPLQEIMQSSERMIALINDLLNVSRIEAGRAMFTLSEFDFNSMVGEVVTSLQPLAHQKKLKFVVQKMEPVMIFADPDKVRQILENVIGNALKFTEKGEVSLRLQSDKELATVLVSDTGTGLLLKDQEKLFAKFEQIAPQGIQVPGTGLGLFISRQYAQKMGGDVKLVESMRGKGSTFAVSLPIAGSETAQKTAKKLATEKDANSRLTVMS